MNRHSSNFHYNTMAYDVRRSSMVRRMVLLSKRNGQLERLKSDYEKMFPDHFHKPLEALPPSDSELNASTSKRRLIQNFKKRFRTAMLEISRMHMSDNLRNGHSTR